jgi:hypothetical protein
MKNAHFFIEEKKFLSKSHSVSLFRGRQFAIISAFLVFSIKLSHLKKKFTFIQKLLQISPRSFHIWPCHNMVIFLSKRLIHLDSSISSFDDFLIQINECRLLE